MIKALNVAKFPERNILKNWSAHKKSERLRRVPALLPKTELVSMHTVDRAPEGMGLASPI